MEVQNQSKNGFHAANLIIITLCILAVFGIGYSAFVKPTTTNQVATGATQIIYNKQPGVPLGGCAIWRMNVRATWDTDPSKEKTK